MENRPRNRKLFNDSRIDYALILPVFLLIIIGFVALGFSLTTDYPLKANTLLIQQGAWLMIGIAAAFFVMHFDVRALWLLAPTIYVIGLVLMVVPIFFYSPAVYMATGAKSWISIHGTTLFEPSELMKVAYILFLSRLVVNFREKNKIQSIRTDLFLIVEMILSFLPIAFVLVGPHMQNDFGTLLVFLAIFAGMLLISGVSWKILMPLILLFTAILAAGVYVIITPNGQHFLNSLGFQSYQSARFQAWLHPFADVQQNSYQQSQALISTAVGGMFGIGSGIGQIAVPVRESDMIFTVIAGGTGFVGASIVIFLYLYLIYRMIRATFRANNLFYTLIATGFTMMLLFHVFENIGAIVGILPLTGIPLPFISQGGSNLISNIIGIGLILSIKYNQESPERRGKTRDKYRRMLAKRMELNKKVTRE
ncbi:FtsW/RodA/SpoVE family cell cycle protein [Lactovum miscens]|uniref:Rod shape determining protein RodA n=1 Tax=Lactovum miscens TaxID=190387 RepID=A0A841C717_9LACT|nr:FtsW/RodA/SpoVE family cell cycle protein [Lactovum miscens]MBB5887189.1 rod shape determining protein RodA [Lactovum miscens]